MHTLLLCCVLVLVAPIAITASSLVPRGQDGFETTIRRNPNFAVDNLQVMITPGDAQSSVAANGDMFTVTVFGLKDGTNYSFSIQALDTMNIPTGIPLTGSYPTPRTGMCFHHLNLHNYAM